MTHDLRTGPPDEFVVVESAAPRVMSIEEHRAICDPWFGTCSVCGNKSRGDDYFDADGNARS